MEWIAFVLIAAAFIWLYLHDRKMDTLEKQDLKLYIDVHIDGQGKITQKASSDLESLLEREGLKQPTKKKVAEVPMESQKG